MASEQRSTNPRQDHDHHPIRRRSCGRRKANVDPNKNKQRRRGMGMAKLEEQRLHELWKNTHHNLHMPTDDFMRSDHARLFNYQHSNSKLNLLPPNCYSLHCNACHKKKKINAEDFSSIDDLHFLGLDNQNIKKQEAPAPQEVGNYGNKVEVVAVHRNGVLVEYDFFPCGGSSIDCEKKAAGCSSMAGFDVDLSLKLS